MNGNQHKSIMEAFQLVGYMVAAASISILVAIVGMHFDSELTVVVSVVLGVTSVAACVFGLTSNYYKAAEQSKSTGK